MNFNEYLKTDPIGAAALHFGRWVDTQVSRELSSVDDNVITLRDDNGKQLIQYEINDGKIAIPQPGKHVAPKPLLMDRNVMIGLMRQERPDLCETSLNTNYGDVSRIMEAVLITMSADELMEKLELAGFAPTPGAGLRLVQDIAKKRRANN